ncbi:MAG: phospho-N-acetylmuramoyl-pentapeptide-transferase [Clostridia bacterium]|nr:phospho-N-acetylmuramoyl-pentapeptide-transferase [Clostridia bacterium]
MVTDYFIYVEAMVISFLLTLFISPFVVSFMRKEKIKQTILHYVDNHSQKAGTPTMGGIIFLLSISIVAYIFFSAQSVLAGISLLVFMGYGLTGFLDDFIKIKFKRNLGLRAYQKIIFQFAIAVTVAIFAYKNQFVGGKLFVPFTNITVDIGWWIIPLVIVVFIACTNSVNLTDGLDGLASSTTMCYTISMVALMFLAIAFKLDGANSLYILEYKNLILLGFVVIGAMICFLVFNCFPAKIFMGDTGSLALGAFVACIAVFSRMTLYIPILGFMFVLSSLSVIIQVAYYKMTKKRVFLMAPLHHHFERKGVHEVRIVVVYSVITVVIGAVTLLLEMIL